MKKNVVLTLSVEEGFDDQNLAAVVCRRLGIDPSEKVALSLQKRSIDARKRSIKVRIEAEVYINESIQNWRKYPVKLQNVSGADPVIIVGSGPAGFFAALGLIERGFKPVILERGKDVRARRRDIAAINKRHIVNPESNYCFGEGGAGTYSDGKLYTRSKKRGDVRKILETLVEFGAPENILYEAHPHIGTNKLPGIIEKMREAVISCGGEVHFNSKVTDLILNSNRVEGVQIQTGEKLKGTAVVLATGHSARDIFRLLAKWKIHIEAKPFALGVRVEHPQELIDSIQYHCAPRGRGPFLPAASYSITSQSILDRTKRGVFSFCMCPGGFIVPSATSPGEIVVNGMSPSRRDSKYANSGIVVAVELEDLEKYDKFGPLRAMEFQREIEIKACTAAGGDQTAPAQRMVDFVDAKVSTELPDCSYRPGLKSMDLHEILPRSISERLMHSFKDFDRKLRGFLTNEAVMVGVESRTSSPVRISRDPNTLEHPHVNRLYPCGEGAGFAGGIVSAALDGWKCSQIISAKNIE